MTNFHWIDALIIAAYLLTLAGIGVWFSRRQTNLEEYFLAGRSMGWLPVGLSLMAALNSGIDYLMQPSATIKYGLGLLVGTTSWLMLYPWVSLVTLPFYRRLNLFTAYEYLEQRFDVRVRSLAAGIFLLWRLGWMATAMYVPCLAVSEATAGRIPLVPMVIVLGVVVTAYTMLGGIKAVIWTDVVQFCVMFGGLAAMVAIVTMQVPGGLEEVLEAAAQVGHAAGPLGHPAPPVGIHGVPMSDPPLLGSIARFFTQPITVAGLLIGTMVSRMTVYTADQVMVQRFQTTRSLRDSRQAFIINAAGDALWMIGLSFIGLALFAYFRHHPLPEGVGGDKLVPRFMAQAFPAGAIGLVVAAIFAASLSSIDSAINSCTSVATVDFYNRLLKGRRSEDPASAGEQAGADPGLAGRHRAVWTHRDGVGAERRTRRGPDRDLQQGHQRVHGSALRNLPARDVQPAGAERRGAGRRAGGDARDAVRRLLQPAQLPMAVDLRLGGDRAGGMAVRASAGRGRGDHPAVDLAERDEAGGAGVGVPGRRARRGQFTFRARRKRRQGRARFGRAGYRAALSVRTRARSENDRFRSLPSSVLITPQQGPKGSAGSPTKCPSMACRSITRILFSLAAVLMAGLPTWGGPSLEARLARGEGRPRLGGLRAVPPETDRARAARHLRVAERRKGPVVIVHRGASSFAPENTLEAYAAAMDYGADGCEIDLRRTHDGVLVLFHDDMLDRLTNGFGTVPEITYYELLSLTPQLRYGRATRTTRPPTFASVLTLARQRAMLLHLDVKEPGLEEEIGRQLDAAHAWDHVTAINTANAASLAKDPRFAGLRYKGPGLYEDRSDVDPAKVRAQLALPGDAIMVDDPRVAAMVLQRRPRGARTGLGDLLEPWPPVPTSFRPDAAARSVDNAFVGQLYVRATHELAMRISDPAGWAFEGHGVSSTSQGMNIRSRAAGAQRLGELGVRDRATIERLENLVRNRSLHREWMYCGLDGAMAARALGRLGSVASVPVLVEAFTRVDPALEKLNQYPAYPASWVDFRMKMFILPALGELRCEASKAFLQRYVRMEAAKARELGPVAFDEATKALFRQDLTRPEIEELLRSPHQAVRGTAILYCVDHPTRARRAALRAAAPWAVGLPRDP
jgi:SSS family transporter